MERTKELEQKIRDGIYEFFAEQCDVSIDQINDDSNIIEVLGGDSLMFLQLIQSWEQDFDVRVDFRKIGKYMTKNPADTIGKTIQLAEALIFEKEKFYALLDS